MPGLADPYTDIDQGSDITSDYYTDPTYPIEHPGLQRQTPDVYTPAPAYRPTPVPSYGVPRPSARLRASDLDLSGGYTFTGADLPAYTPPAPSEEDQPVSLRHGFVQDVIRMGGNSLMQVGQGINDFARAINAKTEKSEGFDEITEGIHNWLTDRMKDAVEGMGPARRQAYVGSLMSSLGLDPTQPGVFEKGGGVGRALDYIAGQAINLVPYIAIGRFTGAAGLGAVMGAGSVGEAYTRGAEALAKEDDAKLQQINPLYRQMRTPVDQGGQGFSERRAKMESAAGLGALIISGASGGLGGALGGQVLKLGALGAKTWSPLWQRFMGALEGGVAGGVMGGGTEVGAQMAQHADQDQQAALREALTSRQTALAAATGAAQGAAVGAIFGARHPGREEKPGPEGSEQGEGRPPAGQPGPSTMGVGDDVRGAVEAALPQGPPTEAGAPTGVPGESPPAEVQTIPRTPAPPPAAPAPAAEEPTGIPGWSPAAPAAAEAAPAVTPEVKPTPVDTRPPAYPAGEGLKVGPVASAEETAASEPSAKPAEEPAKPTEPATQESPELQQIKARIGDTIQGEIDRVKQIRKGDLPGIYQKAVDHIQSELANIKDPEDIPDALAEMRTRQPKEMEMIYKWRQKVVDAIYQDLTGRTETEGAIEETAGPGGIDEEDEVTPEHIETTVAGQAPGGLTSGLAPKPEPTTETGAPKLSRNLREKAAQIMKRLRAGEIDVQQAHELFEKVPGEKRGAKRGEGYRSLEDHLEMLLSRARDKTYAQKLYDQIKAIEEDPKLNATQKRNKINPLRKEFTENTGPVAEGELEGFLNKLRDPVGTLVKETEAAETGKPAETPAAEPSGIPHESSSFVQLARDPRVDTSLVREIQRGVDAGKIHRVHEVLDLLRQHMQVLQSADHPYAMLVNQLRRLAPDLPLYTPKQALDAGVIDQRIYNRFQYEGLVGQYRPLPAGRGRVILNIDAKSPDANVTNTLLHEITHSITSQMLRHLARTDPNHQLVKAMQRIGAEFTKQIAQLKDHPEFSDIAQRNLNYATKNLDEFHTMSMTDPDVQRALRMIRPDAAFMRDWRALGMPDVPTGRSLWRHFVEWTRRALGYRTPVSASEYTMLDHMLHVGEEVYEAGHAYNRKFLPRDPIVGPPAERMMDASERVLSPRSRDMMDHVMDHIDVPGRFGLLRQGIQQFMPTNQIGKVWGNLFDHFSTTGTGARDAKPVMTSNPFTRMTQALQAIAHTNKQARDDNTYGAKAVRDIAKQLDAGGRKLGEFINEVQYNDKGLGDPALKARYDALAPADKAAFDKAEQQYKVQRTREVDAEFAAMVDHAMPEITKAQRDAIMAMGKDKASVEAFMNDPGNSQIAQAFGGTEWAKNADFMNSLAKFQHDAFAVRPNYFPLRRDGNWVVTHGEEGTPDWTVKMFRFRREAERYRQEMLTNNTPNVSQVGKKAEAIGSDLAVNHPATEDLYNKLTSRLGPEAAAVARRELNGILLQRSARQSSFQSKLERQGVRGARTDHGNILTQEFINHANRLGYMRNAKSLHDAVSDMKKIASWHDHYGNKSDGIAARQVAEEMEKRNASIDDYNSPLVSLLGKINGLSFVKNLLSPSHWLTSTLEAHTMAIPQIGADIGGLTGEIQAAAMMGNTMRKLSLSGAAQIGRGLYRGLRGRDVFSDSLNEDIAKILGRGGNKALADSLAKAFDTSGRIDNSYSMDLLHAAKGEGILGGRMSRLAEHTLAMSTYGQHVTDAYNKWTIAFTAAQAYLRRKPGDLAGATRYAMDLVDNSMPDYSPGNKPRISTQRGILRAFGPNAMQFKNYGLFLYSRLGALVHDISYGPDRIRAARALAGVLGAHAMTAGAVGLLADPLRYVMGSWDFVSGKDKPHDYQVNERQWLDRMVGKTWGEYLGAGMTHALGFDVQHRAGVMNAIEMPELNAFSEAGFSDLLGKALLGATGETISSFGHGLSKAFHGDVNGAMLDMLPRAFRDVLKAYNLSQQGVMIAGKQALPPGQIPGYQIGLQALGLQPAVAEETRMGSHAIRQAKEELQAEHTKLTKAWLSATPGDRPAIWQQILDWNRENRGRATPIAREQLQRQLETQRKEAKLPFGIKLPKKAQGLEQAAAFANVPRGAVVAAP